MRRLALVLGAALLCLLALVSSSARAAEQELHAFNPTLSLTGGCETYKLDPVPDPGCPYPAETPPSGSFTIPSGIAVDSYGDVYVATQGANEHEGAIDVFDAEGHYLTEVAEPDREPREIAVDDKGYLYVYSHSLTAPAEILRRHDPVAYEPEAGRIEYDPTPNALGSFGGFFGNVLLAVNPQNDHLFVRGAPPGSQESLREYDSGEAGNALLDASVAEVAAGGRVLAIDAAHGRIYVSNAEHPNAPGEVRRVDVFELAAPHAHLATIDASNAPAGAFGSFTTGAVDEATGHLFLYEPYEAHKIFELDEEGEHLLATIEHGFLYERFAIAVDNGAHSPNGALNPDGRYLWVSSARGGREGHAYAFGPPTECAPTVESISFSHVGEESARLEAEVEPCQLETSYQFEYVEKQQFEESGFAGAQLAGQGAIPAGEQPVPVSAGAAGLSPGQVYVFRVVATNELGSDEGTGEFVTYAPPGIASACPNAALRTGPSALLPDCRAYELVTPSDTNGHAPLGLTAFGTHFATRQASPDGNGLSFLIQGGALQGSDGTGSFAGDPYLASRGTSGWSTESVGPDGSEAFGEQSGSPSPDQGYRFWHAEVAGSAVLGPKGTDYVRYPDGHSEVLGRGSLATDYNAQGKLIAEDGAHIVFTSEVQLEQAAAPSGSKIYDRTADEVTHVVSLLPGNVTPAAGVAYQGASLDGRGVAFTDAESGPSVLYLRSDDSQTYEVGEDLTFEGVAEGGGRIFYLKEGDLYAFDTEAGTIRFTTGGDATVVNVAADGSAAYFVSPDKLTGVANPLGAKAKAGEENLYLSREGAISFIGAVTERDVEGELHNARFGGLGLWGEAVRQEGGAAPGRFAADPSRSTAAGGVLLFESRAELTGYDSAGHAEVYRYDAAAPSLICISCNPTGQAAGSDAKLQTINADSLNETTPLTIYDVTPNLSSGGRRAFFETSDPLVASDIDGLQDVYEWEAQGTESCTRPGGCLYLIGSGQSRRPDYIYAASENGNDVFIESSDTLTPEDADETFSIYDARVNGGFATSQTSGECLGEACQPTVNPPPRPTQQLQGNGNVSKTKNSRCRKGRRRVRRHGKPRCVKRHAHRKRHSHHRRKHRRAHNDGRTRR